MLEDGENSACARVGGYWGTWAWPQEGDCPPKLPSPWGDGGGREWGRSLSLEPALCCGWGRNGRGLVQRLRVGSSESAMRPFLDSRQRNPSCHPAREQVGSEGPLGTHPVMDEVNRVGGGLVAGVSGL